MLELQPRLRIQMVREGKSLNKAVRRSDWIRVMSDASRHGKQHSGDYGNRLFVNITRNVIPLDGLKAAVVKFDNCASPLQLRANRPWRNITRNRSNKCAEPVIFVLKQQISGAA